MVSINQYFILYDNEGEEDLHSTMVSINHICKTPEQAEKEIYIPLWYLLILISEFQARL